MHHSQREGAEAIFSESGREELIASYESAVSLFEVANDDLEEALHKLNVAIGVDTELFSRRVEEEMRKLVGDLAS